VPIQLPAIITSAVLYRNIRLSGEGCLCLVPQVPLVNSCKLQSNGRKRILSNCGRALNSVAWARKWTILTGRTPLVGEVSANFFADSGCHMVSVTDPYSRILGLLYWSPYFFFLVAPKLHSLGWVDLVIKLWWYTQFEGWLKDLCLEFIISETNSIQSQWTQQKKNEENNHISTVILYIYIYTYKNTITISPGQQFVLAHPL
jgi:hypothetical protein